MYVLLQESGQVHDRTDASQSWEFLIHPSDTPQLPSRKAVQPADLATDVQVTEAARDGNSHGEASHFCWTCDRGFKRRQELERHFSEVHMPKSECPFQSCAYKWTRPAKIKYHITEVHGSELHPEVFQEIPELRGKDVVEFVEAYAFDPYKLDSEYNDYLEKTEVVSSEGVFKQFVAAE